MGEEIGNVSDNNPFIGILFVVVFCRIYTRLLVVSYEVLHVLILTASGFQELSVMVYAIFEIPYILCFL